MSQQEYQLQANHLHRLKKSIGCDNKLLFANRSICRRIIEAELCFEKMAKIYEEDPNHNILKQVDCSTVLNGSKRI